MKRTILLEILEITKQQQQALTDEDIDKFSELLEKRQMQMDKLDQLHKQYPEYKEQLEKEIFQEIITIDTANMDVYNKQFEEVKEKLNELRARKRVNNVYTNPYTMANEEGIFFDKGR